KLQAIDSQTLPTRTFMQAYKDYVSSGISPVVGACSTTKKCSCTGAKALCNTQCHPDKKKAE
ncbi:unnamed protein product, partial [Rotaria sp. Silwood2]